MKNVALHDGKWIERVIVRPTAAEKQILSGNASAEEKRQLRTAMAERSWKPISEAEAAQAQEVFERHALKEDATLISADMSLPAGIGILNYRTVSGEHKQVRF